MVKLEDLINLLIEVNLNTNHTVMFNYYGHTQEFSIRFFEGGWEGNMCSTNSDRFYLDLEGWEDKINELYNHYLEILNKDHICGYDEECGF